MSKVKFIRSRKRHEKFEYSSNPVITHQNKSIQQSKGKYPTKSPLIALLGINKNLFSARYINI